MKKNGKNLYKLLRKEISLYGIKSNEKNDNFKKFTIKYDRRGIYCI